MTEGKIEIYLSYREPEYRDNLMWLRPYLDREGFELLYYGANGWTVFVPCHSLINTPPQIDTSHSTENTPNTEIDNKPLISIGTNPIGDMEGRLYEITPAISPPDRKPSCGCPK